MKYHLRPDGQPGKCSASIKACPLGADTVHGETVAELYANFEQAMQGQVLPPANSKREVELNSVEKGLLGTVRLTSDGEPSTVKWPSQEQWPQVRAMLVANSVKSNPKLDPRFTAYTPGETLALMDLPEIEAWHERAKNYRVPEGKTIVFVPCAKTKPWDKTSSVQSSYYSAYHALAADFPKVHFMTISEPLGLVSMEDWGDFLQYDNPGLFHDPAQRSSLHRKAWLEAGYDSALATPFDETAYEASISKLSSVIAPFLASHPNHVKVSLVDGREGEAVTTHGAMLNGALELAPSSVKRFPKRREARISPYAYLYEVLTANAS